MKFGALTTIWLLALYGCSAPETASRETYSKPETQKLWAETCDEWDEWDKPSPAFQIHANTYYVGTCGISSILIVSEKGHILIDGGTEAGAMVISENISSLGYKLSDVKILLHSHEHFDHVAGLAKLQRLSGAKLYASKAARPVLLTGKSIPSDPQHGMHEPFPPSNVSKTLQDDEVVELGDIFLRAIETPGHTEGALSWQWKSCNAESCEWIVYADSLSPIGRDDYKFSDHLNYLKNYKFGLSRLRQLDCTLIVTPHPSASKMMKRLQNEQLSSSDGCENYSDNISQRLQKRIKKEKSQSP
ncbi:MAG: subclass B3 metallo-beta-lactamase [Litorimonas sp.]